MKKMILSVIMLMTLLSLLANNNNKNAFKFLSKKEIRTKVTKENDSHISGYSLDRKDGDIYFFPEIGGEGQASTYLVWKKNNKEISVFPTKKCQEHDPIYFFSRISFSSKSRLWIIPYCFKYTEAYTGEVQINGILFISEDGKNIIKDLKINSVGAPDVYFNRKLKTLENSKDKYNDSDYFFSSHYFISVFGEITYTFPVDLRIEDISFTNDGEFFKFYNEKTKDNYYSVKSNELVYQGLSYYYEYFAVSSDKKWCSAVDTDTGEIIVFKMNPNTHKPIKNYSTNIQRINDIPCTPISYYNKKSKSQDYFYDIKIRFEENTNNLIITTDNKWESVVEVIYEKQ